LTAIGGSQESGALQSWFDSNYRATSEESDPDRKIFGSFMGKIGANFFLISGTLFVVGGVIAALYSRIVLFIISLILVIVALGCIIALMKNETVTESKRSTWQDYIDRLTGGIQFVASSRGHLFFFIGIASTFAIIGAIWYNLMLFPFYASYTSTDAQIGLLRSIIFITGALWMIFAANLSKKAENPHRGYVLSNFAGNIAFFVAVFAFYLLFPSTDAFVLIPFLGIVILGQIANSTGALIGIFQNRLMIELVPDECRNAVYSAIPTLNVIFSIPLVLLGGVVITNYGFTATIILIIVLDFIATVILGLGVYELSKPPMIDVPVDDTTTKFDDVIPESISS
jgi:hypothetical protein